MKKKFYDYQAEWGETYKLSIEKETYANNGTLALILVEKSGEPFADITVNLPFSELDEDEAYVDTNNLPNIGKWLEANKIAKKTEIVGHSGYCTYPVYKFDLKKI